MKKSLYLIARFLLFIASLHFVEGAYATTYYSRTNGGNWNVNTTWSTVTYGNATNAGTYPKAGDIANIGDGYTVYISASVGCATINLGQGTSGILEYKNTAPYTLTVSGDITINNGGTFWYNSVTALTHNLLLGGNLTNYGTIQFAPAANAVVNITFNQATNSTVASGGTWTLNTVTLTKTLATALLDVQSTTFESAVKTLSVTFGTYIHDNTGTYNINSSAAANFTIGPNAIFKVPQGILGFATGANSLTIQGKLYVNGGTCIVGSAAGTQGIFSDQSGANVAYLEVSAGTLNVYGGITYAAASATKPFSFNMTGGNILLNSGSTGTTRELFCITDVAASKFVMSGGTIVMEKPNITGATVADVAICGTTGTVTTTGGTMQFGDANTAAGKVFNFKPYANATYPNFKITGLTANAFSLAASTGSTANFSLYSLYIDVGKTFDIRSINGTTGDTKTMTLAGTWNGIEAFTNNGTFTARQSTVQFNPTGSQSIGGAVTTNFYNLTINNANNITLNKSENVTNVLSMVQGILYTTSAKILTLTGSASSGIGSAVSFVDGPMVETVASLAAKTLTYPIGKAGIYRPEALTVQHNNGASVTYKAEVFNNSAMGLPYILPANISKVSNVRYIQFTRQNVANFMNGKIQMYYGADDGVTDFASLIVAHDDGATQWQNFGGVATGNGNGSITSATFNNFHTFFALGNPPGGTNALPISLLSYHATPEANHIRVDWQTAIEINNHFFTVEHSKDNMNFTAFAQVNGAGNSNTVLSYSVNDYDITSANNYYRLKQTDFDGHYTYSNIIMVYLNSNSTVSVSPNPAITGLVHVSFHAKSLNDVIINFIDLLGRSVYETNYPANETGNYDFNLDISKITNNGIYMLRVSCGEETYTQKVLITGR